MFLAKDGMWVRGFIAFRNVSPSNCYRGMYGDRFFSASNLIAECGGSGL